MLDRLTIRNAEDVSRICATQDWDFLLTLDGGERSGKSSLMADILLAWEPSIRDDIDCGIYDTFFARYAWSWGEWQSRLAAGYNQAIVREEADFLGRESMTEVNRHIVRVLTTVGRRNHRMALLFPDFSKLDVYARERTRVRGFVHARNVAEDGPVRGYVTWYVRHRYPFKRDDGQSVWWIRAFTGHYTHFSKASANHAEVWARFRESEERAKERILLRSMDSRNDRIVSLREKGKTVEEIASQVHLSERRVREIVRTARYSVEPEGEEDGT